MLTADTSNFTVQIGAAHGVAKIKLEPRKNRASTIKLSDDIDEAIEGRRTFDIETKLDLKLKKFNSKHVLCLTGKELSYGYFQTHGFESPILVNQRAGLKLKVPQNCTVDTVVEKVGKTRQIEVINSLTQSSQRWSLAEFARYYSLPTSQQKKKWNAISLEFTGTRLDEEVEPPAVVRELDWVRKVWPLELMHVDLDGTDEEELTFPKVLKYCLMSVEGCYTDFHIDLGGTSVWYHVVYGKKTFWLIPPTQENLDQFEEWSVSGEQETRFLADECSRCQMVTVETGQTFFIPTGWIHAVYTHEKSLVFGGNFLHSFNIGLQLRIASLEETMRVPLKYRYPYFKEMQWYVYDHYNMALTGKSCMRTASGEPVHEQCVLPTGRVVLSKYELQGLRNLREWLANQPSESVPDDLTDKTSLLESMMVCLVKHSKDGDQEQPLPFNSSVLQWKESALFQHRNPVRKTPRKNRNEPKVTSQGKTKPYVKKDLAKSSKEIKSQPDVTKTSESDSGSEAAKRKDKKNKHSKQSVEARGAKRTAAQASNTPPKKLHPKHQELLRSLGEGKHLTAKEFGYSEEHIRSILSTSATGRLSINGGDIVMYTVPGTKDEMRVFVKTNKKASTNWGKTENAEKESASASSDRTKPTAKEPDPVKATDPTASRRRRGADDVSKAAELAKPPAVSESAGKPSIGESSEQPKVSGVRRAKNSGVLWRTKRKARDPTPSPNAKKPKVLADTRLTDFIKNPMKTPTADAKSGKEPTKNTNSPSSVASAKIGPASTEEKRSISRLKDLLQSRSSNVTKKLGQASTGESGGGSTRASLSSKAAISSSHPAMALLEPVGQMTHAHYVRSLSEYFETFKGQNKEIRLPVNHKLVFVSLLQTVDDDMEKLFFGHVLDVGKGSYLYDMASARDVEMVKTIEKPRFFLPLVFVKAQDIACVNSIRAKMCQAKAGPKKANASFTRPNPSPVAATSETAAKPVNAVPTGPNPQQVTTYIMKDTATRRDRPDTLASPPMTNSITLATCKSGPPHQTPQSASSGVKLVECHSLSAPLERVMLLTRLESDSQNEKSVEAAPTAVAKAGAKVAVLVPEHAPKQGQVSGSAAAAVALPSAKSVNSKSILPKPTLWNPSYRKRWVKGGTAIAEQAQPSPPMMSLIKQTTSASSASAGCSKSTAVATPPLGGTVTANSTVGAPPKRTTTLESYFTVDKEPQAKTQLALVAKSDEAKVIRPNGSERPYRKPEYKKPAPVFQPVGKPRRRACRKCEGCRASNCGQCAYCLDMPKYGGTGRRRQRCVQRKCDGLIPSMMDLPRNQLTLDLLIAVKDRKPEHPLDFDGSGGSETEYSDSEAGGSTKEDSAMFMDVDSVSKGTPAVSLPSDLPTTPVSKRPGAEATLPTSPSIKLLKVPTSKIAASLNAIKSSDNCGDCAHCLKEKADAARDGQTATCLIKRKRLKLYTECSEIFMAEKSLSPEHKLKMMDIIDLAPLLELSAIRNAEDCGACGNCDLQGKGTTAPSLCQAKVTSLESYLDGISGRQTSATSAKSSTSTTLLTAPATDEDTADSASMVDSEDTADSTGQTSLHLVDDFIPSVLEVPQPGEKLEDCGKCRFCLDKPKFGGENKMRQLCAVKKAREQQANLARLQPVDSADEEESRRDIAAQKKIIRAMADCGSCVCCLDKPKFGGKNTIRKMCLMKKVKVNALMSPEAEAATANQRTSHRKRKLTTKMEEYLDQSSTGGINLEQMDDRTIMVLKEVSEYIKRVEDVRADDSEADPPIAELCVDDEEDALNTSVLQDIMGMSEFIRKEIEPVEQPAASGSEFVGATASAAAVSESRSDEAVGDGLDSTRRVFADENLLLRIFSHLSVSDLLKSCAPVSKWWRAASAHPGLWKVMDLSGRALTGPVAAAVKRIQPEILDLSRVVSTPPVLKSVLSSLVSCRQLTIRDVEAVACLDLGCIKAPLTCLDMSHNDHLSSASLLALLHADCESHFPLQVESLDLSYTSVPDQAVEVVAQLFTGLKRLSLRGCAKLTNDCLEALASASHTRLVQLDVNGCCGFDAEALDFLFCRGLEKLQRLDLTGCVGLTDEDLDDFVDSPEHVVKTWRRDNRVLHRIVSPTV